MSEPTPLLVVEDLKKYYPVRGGVFAAKVGDVHAVEGVSLTVAAGETLGAVISDLEGNYSGISDRLMENGELNRFVNIYVDDEDVRFSGGLDTAVADGDSVTILPAVAGG